MYFWHSLQESTSLFWTLSFLEKSNPSFIAYTFFLCHISLFYINNKYTNIGIVNTLASVVINIDFDAKVVFPSNCWQNIIAIEPTGIAIKITNTPKITGS